MVIRMADETDPLEAMGALYAERRTQWEDANQDLPETDEMFVELARRLEIILVPPIIHDDGMGMLWCDTCAGVVARAEHHQVWHLRIQAATKVAMWQSNLANLASHFLGLTLRAALERDAEEWTPSGHGWIYLQGDPPGSLRARCGGPAMCGKCRADEQHSIAGADGAAQAYYVRMQDERER